MIDSKIKHLLNDVIGHSHMYRKQYLTEINPNYLDTKKNWIRGTKLLEGNRYSLFSNITSFSYFWNIKTPIFFFFYFPTPNFCQTVPSNLCSMSGLDNSAKTHYQPIFRHCLVAVLQYLAIFYENQRWIPKSGLKTEKILYPGTVNTLESRSIFLRSRFFFFGNVRQFISNSNSSNTKYFYDWPISNSSNTPISNYFLTVRTKEEFTVLWTLCFMVKPRLYFRVVTAICVGVWCFFLFLRYFNNLKTFHISCL